MPEEHDNVNEVETEVTESAAEEAVDSAASSDEDTSEDNTPVEEESTEEESVNEVEATHASIAAGQERRQTARSEDLERKFKPLVKYAEKVMARFEDGVATKQQLRRRGINADIWLRKGLIEEVTE